MQYMIYASVFLLAACGAAQGQDDAAKASKVAVRVFNAGGKLVGPVASARVVKTQDEWKKQLSEDAYRITRRAGTEQAFCGNLLDNKLEGVYSCVCCSLPLFKSGSKFKSGTGWPSFFQPIAKENVGERADNAFGIRRVEILCVRCDAHLGHVFPDGPKPTGLRYCVNSESLRFTNQAFVGTLADPAAEKAKRTTAVFAGGCFWCVEAVFEQLDGVHEVLSGYAGGEAADATYKAVCSGRTGHAEVVRIEYDPRKITFEDLLLVHFATHDPTTLNRQGGDKGPQYRSSIFYATEAEKKTAERVIKSLAKKYSSPIVTKLEPLRKFYPAELVHQNFVRDNPNQGYVRAVALPKVEKVRKKFKDKLKPEEK